MGTVLAVDDVPPRLAGSASSAPAELVPGGAGPLAGVRVLVPRTRDRQGSLAGHLRQLGCEVVETVVSRLESASASAVPRDVPAPPDPGVAEELSHAAFDVVAFASSTAARMTARLYQPFPESLLVVAMGRHTVAACRQAGLRVDAVASRPGIHPLADAVAEAVGVARGTTGPGPGPGET